MRIQIESCHGAEIAIDTEGTHPSVDGMDTLLRQLGEALARTVESDLTAQCGCGNDCEAEAATAEAEE